MIETYLLVLGGLLLLTIGPLLVLLSIRSIRKANGVSARLSDLLADDLGTPRPVRRQLAIRTREFTGSFTSRIMLPWFNWFGRVFSRLTPAGTIEQLERKLIIAGNPFGLKAREFYGVRLALIIIGAGVSITLLIRGGDRAWIVLSLLIFLLSILLPQGWLERLVRIRQDKIRKGLPDALDMLSVCASAGLGFDQSMKRVSEYWDTPVAQEFGRVITEVEMGLSRREALRNLANRLDVAELSSFVSFILQTEQLGLSVSDTLHSQADHMRIERRMRAQEQAQKVPTKMIFPMALLIFPALLAIILGPVIPQLIIFFDNFSAGR